MSVARNNPDFRPNNRSGTVIHEVSVGSSANPNRGRDPLGSNVLPSGQCTDDIRVVHENGAAQERMGVNTCGITGFDLAR